MRPGPFPWAENDTYAAGPDIGSGTRAESPQVLKDDGYYRSRRPAPDVLNYVLHRASYVQKFLARMQAFSLRRRLQAALGAFESLEASSHGIGTTGQNIFFYGYDSGGPQIYETQTVTSDVGAYNATINSVFAVAGVSTVDADHESNETDDHRIVVADDGAGSDLVYYATTIGPAVFGTVTFTAGAPGNDWRAIACDRNNQEWIICSAVKAGTTYVWRSTDGINFAIVAGWPGGTVTTDIQFAGHSNHFTGALGPDDPGNETYLVLSDTYAVRSDDGITWTAAAHGLGLGGSNLNNKSAAYSRTSGRWIIPLPGTNWGDIAYSEDNGATWTTNVNAIPGASGSADPCICSNGHGVFMVWKQKDADRNVWISVDDGDTWTAEIIPEDGDQSSTPDDGRYYEAVYDQKKKAYEMSDYEEFFIGADFDDTTGEFDIFRTLKS